MKLDSALFDKIRVKPKNAKQPRGKLPGCAWPDCSERGLHPAPKGRGREGQYFYFCIEHVREYNRSYNYFNGMSDQDVASYQEQNVTGHRPTWRMGSNTAQGRFSQEGATAWTGETLADPLGLFKRHNGATYYGSRPQRVVNNAERKAREALNLDAEADAARIKARYKEMVKRHHPDANGGNRASEEKLREIIQAYTYLKSAGFC